MKVDLGIWDWLARLILVLLVLAAGLGVALWYLPLFQQNERMRKEIAEKEALIRTQQQLAVRLKTALEAHRDPRTIERLAREQLNYAKPGETVIRFAEPLTNPPLARRPTEGGPPGDAGGSGGP